MTRPSDNLDMNSKWTSKESRLGWRHFRVVGRRYADKQLFIELMAACDTAARFWLPATELKAGDAFAPGWRGLSQ